MIEVIAFFIACGIAGFAIGLLLNHPPARPYYYSPPTVSPDRLLAEIETEMDRRGLRDKPLGAAPTADEIVAAEARRKRQEMIRLERNRAEAIERRERTKPTFNKPVSHDPALWKD